jgi:penicillin-binding protein 2
MAERSSRRLQVVAVLVASLVLTLMGRLYYVQVLDGHKPRQTAGQLHDGRIVVPAPRGEIVDARGRPLVSNKITHVVTVDREAVQAQPGNGVAVLARLAALLGVPQRDLAQEITPCSVHVPSPCWTGEPFQPVPVDPDASTATVLALSEHRENYPGVAVETQTVRDYPGGALAAHLLGYTGAVSAADEKNDHALHDADTIGRSGLEEQYDSILRGMDGAQIVQLDPRGNSVGAGRELPAEPGDTLVTSIDRTSSSWPSRRSPSRSPTLARKASLRRARRSSSWTRTPGASSRPRAIPATTHKSSSAASRLPTTQGSPRRARTTRSSTAPSPASTHPARRSS